MGVSTTSHPMWVRGLKLGHLAPLDVELQSHPMWVRGLKLLYGRIITYLSVAPYVGAWIET